MLLDARRGQAPRRGACAGGSAAHDVIVCESTYEDSLRPVSEGRHGPHIYLPLFRKYLSSRPPLAISCET